jgi:ubiquinone/menaquinone biosynthesis C-methylase UbiE
MIEKLDCTSSCGDIVEFGCGYGTFTIPSAQICRGRVYAQDIEPEMVAVTARKSQEAGLTNVIAQVRDFLAEGCGLANEQVEYAMLFNILHIENPLELLREAHRVLTPGGTVAMIHWRRDINTPRGPSMPIRPTAEQCRVWGESTGFEFVRYESLCCCSWHWGLIMRKPTGNRATTECGTA